MSTHFVDISPKQDGGVLKCVIKEGKGEELPPAESMVKVHYIGLLLNGAQFDSSRDRNKPFEFSLGKGLIMVI